MADALKALDALELMIGGCPEIDVVRAALSVQGEPVAFDALREWETVCLVAADARNIGVVPVKSSAILAINAELERLRALSVQGEPIGYARPEAVKALQERQAGWCGRADYLHTKRSPDEGYTHPLYAAPAAPAAVQGEPMFWYRPCAGGMYEGPHHHNSVGGRMLRDEKPGEWVPLYAAPAAPAVPPESVEALAHRIAWRYKKSSDPHHSDTYTFNRATLLQFAVALAAAPSAPGADTAA